MADLKQLVDQWLALDHNPITRGQIQDLWDARNETELERRLRNRIEFGTAGKIASAMCIILYLRSCHIGLRGRMEAGFARMNDLIIIQASQVQ